MRNCVESRNPTLTIDIRGGGRQSVPAIPGDRHVAGSTLYLDIMASVTEITLLTGERCRVEGEAKDVERLIIDAARGSIV
ncbi:MAG TPA: hypothetical protein VMG37_12645 [Solirubrobacteraceae bacterium]|nr:hypothetical protein [Solirubrobacteraceae bacterium]